MKEESEGRAERLAEALAVESRCLLALLRMGCDLGQAEGLLAEALREKMRAEDGQPSALGGLNGSQRQSKRGLSLA
jgi:hypothetical protein